MHNKSQGFGVVPVILVICTIALLGVIVWRIYDASKSKQDNSTTQTSNTQAANTEPQNNSRKTETATYLDIKEFGVKIKLSDDIQDAVYYYDTSTSVPVVRVSTQTLIDKTQGACAPSIGSPFGTLRKTQSLTLPNGAALKVDGANVFQFGADYIVYATPNQPCSTDAVVKSTEIAQLASFKKALMTMQLDQ